MTSDANAGALDAGVDTALVFADKCKNGLLNSYLDKILQNIFDKCFSAKSSTLLK